MIILLFSGLILVILFGGVPFGKISGERTGWARRPAFRWEGCFVLTAALLFGCSSPDHYPSEPLSPQAAIDSFQINEDFRVEVFAAEPHVVEPVDLTFDAQGRAFAVELRDFPYETDSTEGRSRIRLLEDTDGDGRIDQSTVFADSLTEATSALPWKDGLLVTAAPNILYLKDTDGDKKADVRRVLFTGFFTGNIEAQITNLHFGIDNWIYASNAGHAGNITFTERPEAPPVSVRGGDFRFRLDRGRFRKAAGTGRFGQTFDEWGHRFVTQAAIHVQQVVLPEPYRSRNPFLSTLEDEKDISAHGPRMYQLTEAPYWRVVRTKRRNERYDEAGLDRTEHASDYFTGATGGTIYAGDTFPEAYHGNLFTADIAGSLVHRDVLRSEGVTFAAHRPPAEQNREFLASTDPWFRPTNFEVGPDGNLYLVDMYRLHVESPVSIPDDLEKEMNYARGKKHGRIYRIVPKSVFSSNTTHPTLGEAKTSALVQALSHPNRWQRRTAQRLLLERQDKSAVPLLQDLVSESESPQARLHALYALEGLSALDATLIRNMLKDPHPGVREHAVRLAERFPELRPQLTRMTDDPAPRVVFQVVLSLGAFSGNRVVDALGRVAAKHGQNPWVRRALLSSKVGSSVNLLETLVRDYRFFRPPDSDDEERGRREELLEQLAEAVGARGKAKEIGRFLRLLSGAKGLQDKALQVSGLSGLAQGLEVEEKTNRLDAPSAEKPLSKLLSSPSDTVQSAAGTVAKHFEMRN